MLRAGTRRALTQRLAGAGLLALAWLLVAPTAVGGATTLVMVDGHSMEPLLYTGDLAVAIRKPEYHAGDLVVFTVGGGLVIHRLLRESNDGTWRTQGDNKKTPDPWRISESQIKGHYLLGLPGVGVKLRWIQRQPLVVGGGAALLTLALFVPWRRHGGASPEHQPDASRGDVWVTIAMCGVGGAACLMLALAIVGSGRPLLSVLPLTLGIGGLVAVGFGVLLLTDLTAKAPVTDAGMPATEFAIEGS